MEAMAVNAFTEGETNLTSSGEMPCEAAFATVHQSIPLG